MWSLSLSRTLCAYLLCVSVVPACPCSPICLRSRARSLFLTIRHAACGVPHPPFPPAHHHRLLVASSSGSGSAKGSAALPAASAASQPHSSHARSDAPRIASAPLDTQQSSASSRRTGRPLSSSSQRGADLAACAKSSAGVFFFSIFLAFVLENSTIF